MEDKTFELLTKMYGEFTEFKKDMNEFREETNSNIKGLNNEVQGLKNDVIRMENKMDAAYDGYKVTYEKLQEHDRRFDRLEEKMENQDLEIKVIKKTGA